jgi:mono/diheme cytochrome c family protein
MALAALGATVLALEVRRTPPSTAATAAPTPAPDAALVARGAYLALAGNCAGCHTARGGPAYAGGRAIDTPFGTVFTSNLTPDVATGLGSWTADDFWQALHDGRSRDGRRLYPAFPYPNYSVVTREDADALFAYLRSLPAVAAAPPPHRVRFPYRLQAALAVWRALYFHPVPLASEPSRSPEWLRGRYLVRGLGHCDACHGERNALGAITGDIELGGGLIPMQNWYAPSLASPREAGVADWSQDEVVALLKTGVAPRASVMGPMAELVFRSTQHLSDADLAAMATYLRALPGAPRTAPAATAPAPVDDERRRAGAALYDTHCADCHGKQGEGVAGRYPALAGNRAVTLASPHNVVKAIVHGGFAPATAGNPRPYGMPPYGQLLNDEEVARLATFLRQSWGHRAAAVTALDVLRAR